MPSFEHEILVLLVRQHPELVLQLLGETLGLPEGTTEVLADSENLSSLVPVELRADSVLVVRGPTGSVVAALVVEVQLDTDPDKHFSWPAYLIGARMRWRCPVSVVVITTSSRVARWAALHRDRAARPVVDARAGCDRTRRGLRDTVTRSAAAGCSCLPWTFAAGC